MGPICGIVKAIGFGVMLIIGPAEDTAPGATYTARRMAEFNLWLLVLGIAAGAAVTWVVIGTISRNDDEVAAEEQVAEAEWIARTIEEHGGRAPSELVTQILALHRRYLQGGAVIPVPEPEPEADADTDASDGRVEVPEEVEAANGAVNVAGSEAVSAGPKRSARRRARR
jgi:hypothetical protein